MSDLKYYTPSIEEFHVGFEYEYRNHDGTVKNNTVLNYWNKSTISDLNELSYVERGLQTPNNTRVKYLDKDDIESLGFTHDPNEDQEETPCQFDIHGYSSGYILDHQDTELKTAYIMYHFPDNFVIIESIVNCGSGKENMLFRGTIKNKSELEQVLKMLNIK